MGSIPAIPDALNVSLLLCHKRFNEASLPELTSGIDTVKLQHTGTLKTSDTVKLNQFRTHLTKNLNAEEFRGSSGPAY